MNPDSSEHLDESFTEAVAVTTELPESGFEGFAESPLPSAEENKANAAAEDLRAALGNNG